LALAGPSHALDYCLDTGGSVIRVPRFRIPAKAACKIYAGWQGPDVATVTACTNGEGNALRIGYTLHPGSIGGGDDGGYSEIGQINIFLPLGQIGQASIRYIGPDGESDRYVGGSALVRPCIPPVEQLP
jgi:hypothetical protein